jgi:Helicase conserved C-terminal domain
MSGIPFLIRLILLTTSELEPSLHMLPSVHALCTEPPCKGPQPSRFLLQNKLQDLLKTKKGRVVNNRKLVDFYHANRSTEERAAVQGAWMNGNTRILAATVAFGMGIDKPDVRWVFHHSMSKSLEGTAY